MCELISAATMASMTGIKTAAAFTVLDAISVIGVMGSVGGAYGQSQAMKDMYAFEDAKARNNAIIRGRQAEAKEKEGKELANRKRAQVKSMVSTSKAVLAGQGVDVADEQSVNLLAETAALGEFEAKQLERNAERDAAALRADQANLLADASAAGYASDAQNPLFDAGTTALTGLGRVGAQWYKRA